MEMILSTYGSLKRGFHNAKYLRDAKFIGEASIENMQLYDQHSYPAMGEGKRTIKGEIYEIDKALLGLLDNLEGYSPQSKNPNYFRKESQVKTESGSVMAFVYVGNPKRRSMQDENAIDHDEWTKEDAGYKK